MSPEVWSSDDISLSVPNYPQFAIQFVQFYPTCPKLPHQSVASFLPLSQALTNISFWYHDLKIISRTINKLDAFMGII